MASLEETTAEGARRRVHRLMLAGWVDSLCLSFAWTLILLEVLRRHGLQAAGFAGAAMLVGTALSAPVATHLSVRLGGRQLLRTAAAAEAVLRVGVFALLLADAGMWSLVVCIAVMNVTAWTGYAGMRAEVAAISPGPTAITWYGTGVAAVEAVGVAAAALVPASVVQGLSPAVVCIVAVYVLALLPTVLVAGGSTVAAVRTVQGGPADARPSMPLVAGVLLMALASAPTLLTVAIAAELHGRAAVAPAAIAFTVGALSAPYLAGIVQRRRANGPVTWILCATGMVVLWPVAGLSIPVLCAAQLASGLFMTTLEGLLDATTAARARGAVTGALARGSAGRALGSAAGTAALPFGLGAVGLSAVTGTLGVGLLTAGLVTAGWFRRDRRMLAASGVVRPDRDGPYAGRMPARLDWQ